MPNNNNSSYGQITSRMKKRNKKAEKRYNKRVRKDERRVAKGKEPKNYALKQRRASMMSPNLTVSGYANAR